MSEPAANKRKARALFAAIEAADARALAAHFTNDARWVIPKSAAEPYAGTHSGADRIADMMVGALANSFEAGSADWQPGLMVAEDRYVMAEARLRATTPAGEAYENEYVFVFEFDPDSGRIQELREHVDTRYAASFFS